MVLLLSAVVLDLSGGAVMEVKDTNPPNCQEKREERDQKEQDDFSFV